MVSTDLMYQTIMELRDRVTRLESKIESMHLPLAHKESFPWQALLEPIWIRAVISAAAFGTGTMTAIEAFQLAAK